MTISSDYDAVAALLATSKRILFITGAGISADSGLPTYRGIGGLYDEQLTAEGMRIEEALSGRIMQQRPEITWKYLGEIEANCRSAGPNAAHRILAELERQNPEVTVLTQNVDGLHRAAGSNNLIEIHGTLHHLHCLECAYETDVKDYSGLFLPPTCPRCSGLLRPDIVLFGEMLPTEAVQRLQWLLDQGLDMVVSIGTTSVFPYIAGPVVWAHEEGIPTVEINPGDTTVSEFAAYRLRTGASEALTELWDRVQPGNA